MDDFNAKSDNVQSESEDKIFEMEEMVNNNLEYSEAEPFDLSRPKKECGVFDGPFCSSHKDCKHCHCLHVSFCNRSSRGGSRKCLCYWYIDPNCYEYDNSKDYFNWDFRDCIWFCKIDNKIVFTQPIYTAKPKRVEQGACRKILWWKQGHPAIITGFPCYRKNSNVTKCSDCSKFKNVVSQNSQCTYKITLFNIKLITL